MGDQRRCVPTWVAVLLLCAASGSAWAQGLQGEYWQGATIPATPGVPAGTPNPIRIDPDVNFTDNAAAGTNDFNLANEDNFVVRWTGFVQGPVTGTVTFTVTTDDGSDLVVGGQQIMSSWIGQGPTPYSGTLNMVQGTWYPLTYLYYEGAVTCQARLSWSYTGQTDIVIPTSALSPTAAPPAAPVLASPAVAGDTQVTLSWTHSGTPAATEFRVYTVNGGVYTLVGTTTNMTFTVTGLTNGQAYSFVVRAYNMVESPDSNVVVATPTLPAPRYNDHEEGTDDRQCACGSAAGPGSAGFLTAGFLLILLLSARALKA